MSGHIRPLARLHGPVFLVNSRFRRFPAAPRRCEPRGAPLVPKLRGQFAEFLLPSCLEHLGLLAPSTCVGLRYGRAARSLRGFSWRAVRRRPFGPKPPGGPGEGPSARGFASARALRPSAAIPSAAPPSSARRPVGQARATRYGNLRPFPIGYAPRPRLRPRLTLGRLASPRKPWTSGARVFHPRFRILMPAFSFPMPPARVAARLPGPTERSPTAPARRRGPTTSVARLAPIIFGAGPLDQ